MPVMYIATFFVALFSSLLSGMAGGGASFIMAPYWLISGMTPAQGAATGAFTAIGMGGGSIAAFKGTNHMPKDKKLILTLLLVALISSAIGPLFLQHINSDTFRPILAIITIISLPMLFIKRENIHLGKKSKSIGLIVMAVLLLASSFITSSAFSILMAITLTKQLNLTILEGVVIRRLIGSVQSVVIFIVLASLGNFIWQHAFTGLLGGIVGSYVGTKFSIQKGEKWAKYALCVAATISSIILLA